MHPFETFLPPEYRDSCPPSNKHRCQVAMAAPSNASKNGIHMAATVQSPSRSVRATAAVEATPEQLASVAAFLAKAKEAYAADPGMCTRRLLSAFKTPPAHTTRSTCSDNGGIPSQSWAVKRIASRVMEEDPKIVERVMVVLEDHAELKCDVVALVSASMQAWTVGTPLD